MRGTVHVPGYPHRLTVLDDGRVAVTARYAGTLSIVDPAATEVQSSVEVGADPFGVIEVDDELIVALAGQDELVRIEKNAPTAVKDRIALLQGEPRGLALLPTGELYVSHFKSGTLSKVNLELGAPEAEVPLTMPNNPNFEAKQLEALTVSPSGDSVATPHQECNNDPAQFNEGSFAGTVPYYASGPTGYPAVVPAVTRVDPELGVHMDEGPGEISADVRFTGDQEPEPEGRVPGVINPLAYNVVDTHKVNAPVAVALADGGRTELVVNRGSGNVLVRRTYLGEGQRSIAAVLNVGVGAESIVLSPDGETAFVYNPFESEVVSFAVPRLGHGEQTGDGAVSPTDILNRRVTSQRNEIINLTPENRFTVAEPALPADVRRGRVLFNSVSQELSALGTVSCASCHPGGSDDGTTWSFGQGPRQTPPLWGGLSETEPYHWDQTLVDMSEIVGFTVMVRMGGYGLPDDDIDALEAFVNTIPAPATAVMEEQASVDNGREIFFSEATGCATCHAGGHYTDNLAHYVGTGVDEINGETMDVFATPQLKGIARSAPYMHDGSAVTLDQLVEDYVRTDRMGDGSHLSDADAADLVAFLKTL